MRLWEILPEMIFYLWNWTASYGACGALSAKLEGQGDRIRGDRSRNVLRLAGGAASRSAAEQGNGVRRLDMAGDHTVATRLGQLLAEIQVEALAGADEALHTPAERSRREFREIARLATRCCADFERLTALGA